MKHCRDYEQDLVTIAHGGEAPEAQAHADACERCADKLSQHHRLAAVLAVPTWLPSEDGLRRAQAIVPAPTRTVARLVRSTLGLAGARYGGHDSFQLVYESDTLDARLMFESSSRGWTITGRLEGPVEEASVGGTIVELDEEGRFTASLSNGNSDDILVRMEGGDVVLPLPPEVASRGSDRAP